MDRSDIISHTQASWPSYWIYHRQRAKGSEAGKPYLVEGRAAKPLVCQRQVLNARALEAPATLLSHAARVQLAHDEVEHPACGSAEAATTYNHISLGRIFYCESYVDRALCDG